MAKAQQQINQLENELKLSRKQVDLLKNELVHLKSKYGCGTDTIRDGHLSQNTVNIHSKSVASKQHHCRQWNN